MIVDASTESILSAVEGLSTGFSPLNRAPSLALWEREAVKKWPLPFDQAQDQRRSA
jgi:hypothetical protein